MEKLQILRLRKSVDTNVKTTMRRITGDIRSTPPWLPKLSHIIPPQLRRLYSLTNEYRKITVNNIRSIHQDIEDTMVTPLEIHP